MPPSLVSSSTKTLPLSYADQAKKAQSAKPSNSAVASHSGTTHASTAVGAGAPSNPGAPILSPDSTVSNNIPDSSAALSNSHPAPPSISDARDVNIVNGDLRSTANRATPAAIPATQKSSPTVNAWSARKFTQGQSQAKPPSSSSAQNHSQMPRQRSPPPATNSTSNNINPPPSDSTQNGTHKQKKRTPINDLSSATDAADDPFVVRVPPHGRQPPPPRPPSIHDADSWPEVGKAMGANSNQRSPISLRDGNVEGDDSKEPGNSSAPGSATRKSEKTKWVQIPAEELQAAADALNASTRQSHSRSQWQQNHSGPKQGNHSRNNQSSGSASAQGPSRSHSGRNSLSHSVSQSQIHSRTGSPHSSPKYGGRGKRLSTEEPMGGTNVIVSAPSAISGPPQALGNPGARENAVPAYPPFVYAPAPDQAGSPASYAMAEASISLQPSVFPQNHERRSLRPPSPGPLVIPDASGYIPHNTASLVHAPTSMPTYSMYPPPRILEQGRPYTHYDADHQHPAYLSPLPSFPQQLDQTQQPAVIPAPPASSRTTGISGTQPPSDGRGGPLNMSSDVHDTRGQRVVFGSIGLPGSSKGPSPTLLGTDGETMEPKSPETVSVEKRNKTFSVGLCPGEHGPSRSRVNKGRKRTGTTSSKSDAVSAATSSMGTTALGTENEEKFDDASPMERTVIDLTRTETGIKWEFGSIGSSQVDSGTLEVNVPSEPVSSSPPLTASAPIGEQVPAHRPAGLSQPRIQTSLVDQQPKSRLVSPLNALPMAAPFPVQRSAIPLLTTDPSAGVANELEVKDYGYGFGHGMPPAMPHEERLERDREREWLDMERDQRERQREQEREREYNGRPRRGSYGSGYHGYERGNYSGRRGRGSNGGYGGRGYHSRGGRGMYQPQQQRQPPFTITPPPQFQPLSASSEPTGSYYAPARPPLATYIPTGYETYPVPPPHPPNAPPLPMPLSALSFPLDPTRWYLLGQLEYYLSPQNMAQDFFLRQKMDSRGWIPISLIASFNRVKHMTVDPSLVREVLVLSTVVEVKDDWVRMMGWEQFVLPNASKSEVEGIALEESEGQTQTMENVNVEARESEGETEEGDVDAEADGEEEEEEEEEVVFVLENESEPWSPDRRQA